MRLVSILFIISLSIFAKEEMLTLQSKIDGKDYILKIDQMKIDVNIIGNIAETSLDITFKNDLNKQIEGTLYLALKENANIFEYQFEMNTSTGSASTMKKAVIVEKLKARVTYEEIVRKKVDPSLLTWTKGNNFKTRIYPINAKSTKRIIVSYQEELTPNFNKNCKGKCPSYYYNLPLNIKYKISKFSVKINGNRNQISPMIKRNRFRSDKLGKLVLIDENYIPNENIKLAIFNKNALNRKPIINVSYNPSKKNYYFTATVFPKKKVIEKDNPEKICIYWDNSMSINTRKLQKEINFIKEYIKYLAKSNISLIKFSNTQEVLGEYVSNTGKSPKKLLNEIKNTIYDGGTQLGLINTEKTSNNCQEALVFTDGVSNFANSEPRLTIPTYFINTKLTAEHSYMKYLANKSGGTYINLQNTTINKALTIIKNQPLRFLSKSPFFMFLGMRKNILETYPNTPTKIQNSFTIVGIINPSNSSSKQKINLHFGIDNKTSQTITISLPISKTCKAKLSCFPHSPIIERQFARHKIAYLVETLSQASQREEIINTSKKHSILTEFTSFLVLESLDDYLKYKIVPPKDMQKEYFEALEKQRVTKLESLNNQVEKVLGKFNEFKTYWSKKHKTKKELIEEKKNNKNKKELEDLRNTKTRKEIVLRVKSKKQVIDIGEFVVK